MKTVMVNGMEKLWESKIKIGGLLFSLLFIAIIYMQIFYGVDTVNNQQNSCFSPSNSPPTDFTLTITPQEALFAPTNPGEITSDNAHHLSQLGSYKTEKPVITDIAFSPTGDFLAVANGQFIFILDATTYTLVTVLEGHQDQILRLDFNPDGTKLASASRDKSVRIWDTSTWSEVATISGFSGGVYDVTFSQDGQLLVTGGNADDGIKIWNAETYTLIKEWTQRSQLVDSIALNPNGNCFVISEMPPQATGGRTAHLINLATFVDQTLPLRHKGDISRVLFSPSGNWIASAGLDGFVRILDISSNGNLTVFEQTSAIFDIAFNPAGNLLASATSPLSGMGNSSIEIWNLINQTRISTIYAHSNLISAVAFSPDGKILVSAGWDGMVLFWGITTG